MPTWFLARHWLFIVPFLVWLPQLAPPELWSSPGQWLVREPHRLCVGLMSFTLALNLKQLQPSDLVLPLALICPWCLDQSKSEQVLTLSVMAAVCLQAYVVQRGDHPRLWLAILTLETIMLTYVPFFELKWWFGCTPLVGLRQSFDVSQAIPEVFILTVCTSILGWNWNLNTRWLHRNAKAS